MLNIVLDNNARGRENNVMHKYKWIVVN